jgi:hypothetical protein
MLLTSCMVKEFQNRRDFRSCCRIWNHQKSRILVQLWRNQIRTSRDAVKSLIKDNPNWLMN